MQKLPRFWFASRGSGPLLSRGACCLEVCPRRRRRTLLTSACCSRRLRGRRTTPRIAPQRGAVVV